MEIQENKRSFKAREREARTEKNSGIGMFFQDEKLLFFNFLDDVKISLPIPLCRGFCHVDENVVLSAADGRYFC